MTEPSSGPEDRPSEPAAAPETGGPDGSEPTALAGPAVPGYEVLSRLGRGGMGEVFKARQLSLNRVVALKVVPQQAPRADLTERLRREALALAQLSHPHIVNVYDSGEASGSYYYAMEYVDGGNLRQLLRRRGRLASAEALAILLEVCDGLAYAHARGFVHRDVKPGNILLDRQGRAKVADFGLAKLLCENLPSGETALTSPGQVLGTVHYMAPEQQSNASSVDRRADVYSLGVILYEMLTGTLPLGRFDPPSQKAGTDARLDAVVLKMLEADPGRRYAGAFEVIEAVHGVTRRAIPAVSQQAPLTIVFRKLSESPLAAPRPGEVYLRPGRPEYRNRRELAALVLEHGVDVLERDPGEAKCIVADVDATSPTLDDMLAASFAVRLLVGDTLPEGCRAFARYAAVVREGLRVHGAPLESSLEGIYLALRAAAGPDLTDPEAGARFREDWSRLVQAILRAAEAGQDPFTTLLFASGADFARERAFLTRDQEVYEQDLLRGERWLVALPGGPPEASGLLLRQPRSLLFKHWSRSDRAAPAGGRYLFLAVDWGNGTWVFSTDPIYRLSLQSLAAALQAAEAKADAVRAAAHPWFDGKPFSHTLVASPRGGTRLAEEMVLRVVREWSGARAAR
jgi:serine/threonine protein kinase